MYTVYLALGTNLGDRQANLMTAIIHMGTSGLMVQRCSSIWETEPVGFTDQPWFFNAVVEAITNLEPLELLRRMKQVEQVIGRENTVRNGPRIIDIDLLFSGETIIVSEELTLPHPRLAERRFVLEPMAELAAGLRHPLSGKTIEELLAAAPPLAMVKIGN